MTLDLFTTTDCDHLPIEKRKFINGELVCTICTRVLRLADGTDVSMQREAKQ